MPDDYRALAAKCRSLAERISDPRTVDVLLKLAEDYDRKAAAGDSAPTEDKGPAPGPINGNGAP
jgi:hypothetical protein